MRGFKDSSLGPGKYLAVGSVEYQNKIYGSWLGAVFFDQGVATDHFGSPWNKGTGVGIIYDSMIGPIKVYLARAISKHNRPYDVEFSLGPEF